MPSVLQGWMQNLTLMQQSVLISAVRGPDGLHKDHIAKYVLRWLRRCILLAAFEGKALLDPVNGNGGSFTGPVKHPDPKEEQRYRKLLGQPDPNENRYWQFVLNGCAKAYLRAVDEVPHHFHLHLMHAAEILGYKHPVEWIRTWWHGFYLDLVHDAHLHPESEAEMDRRLGDVEAQWREREVVTAADVPLVQRGHT